MEWRILDAQTRQGIPNATMEVYRSGETVPFVTAFTDADGRARVENLSAGTYRFLATATNYSSDSRTVTLAGNSTVTREWPLYRCCNAALAADFPVVLPLLILVVTSALLGGVLFARIQRNDLLQHVVRQRLYEYLQANPGKHYRAILDELDLAMGTLTYHLNTLERGGYIVSQQDGMYRRFYPAGRRAEVAFFLTAVQQRIVLALKENAGISQVRLADSLAISPSLVNYHLHILAEAGLVRHEPRGRESGCFLVEGPARAP